MKEDLKISNDSDNDKTFYPCEKCDQRFTTIRLLKQHRDKEHQGSPHECRVCLKVYSRISHLKRHIVGTHPELGLTCGKGFTDCSFCKQNLRKNELQEHLKCCPERSKNLYDLKKIVKIDCSYFDYGSGHNTSASKCQRTSNDSKQEPKDDDLIGQPIFEIICKAKPEFKTYPNIVNYMGNYIETDASQPKEIIPVSTIKTTKGNKKKRTKKRKVSTNFCCDKCGKTYTSSVLLVRHAKTHKMQKAYACQKCPKSFMYSKGLQQHMDLHLNNLKNKCELCDTIFSRAEHLQRHRKEQHNPIPKKELEYCPVCSKGFKFARYMRQHLHIHKKFQCNSCTETFQTGEALEEHNKSHKHDIDNKPFTCSECDIRFVCNDLLMIHMRRHIGAKSFMCKYCDKAFNNSDAMKMHERNHTDQKAHVCKICANGFHRAFDLRAHMQIHNKRLHKCSVCDMKFTEKKDLKSHVHKHARDRFKCDICDVGFSQLHQVVQHKRNVHARKVRSKNDRKEKCTKTRKKTNAEKSKTDTPMSIADYWKPEIMEFNGAKQRHENNLPPPVEVIKVDNGEVTRNFELVKILQTHNEHSKPMVKRSKNS